MFESRNDLEYYVYQDKAHLEFGKFIGPLLDAEDGGAVLDFNEGDF